MSWCYTSGPQSGFYTPPPGVFCIKRIENFCNNSPEQVNLKKKNYVNYTKIDICGWWFRSALNFGF